MNIPKNFHLLRELVRRDLRARFTGSAFGLAWAVIQPLTYIAIYWFVFTYMFAPRAGEPGAGYIEFLVAGLLPWMGLSEGVMRSVTSIVDNAPVVRKLAIRSELLVIVPNVSALVFEIVALALFSLFVVSRGGGLPALWLWPVALLFQLAIQLGIGWFLAATYVFFRDLAPLVGFVLSVLFYLSPILYPATGRFGAVLRWNPMTPLLGLFRSATTSASLPQAGSIVFLLITAISLFAGGLAFFRRTRAALVDLI